MTGTAVHFGAGNIGRGFVGLLLHRAGYRVVFADVAAPLIDALQATPSYRVHAVGLESSTETVQDYGAINSRTDEAALVKQIATADIVTTAVGPTVLAFLAPAIAAGVLARPADAPPVAVMACENAINATDVLAGHIREHCSDSEWAAITARAVFANTAVDRIVAAQATEGLDVTVETYFEWAIETPPFAGAAPAIPDATWVPTLPPTSNESCAPSIPVTRPPPTRGTFEGSASCPTRWPTTRSAARCRECSPRPRRCWWPSTSSATRRSRHTSTRSSPGSPTHTCRTPLNGSASNPCASCRVTSG